MKRWLLRIFMVIIWLGLLGGGFVAYEAHKFLTTPASTESRDILFSINPGATFDRVAWDLKKAGVITDVFRFRVLAYAHESLGKIKAGEYMVNTGWTPEQVLDQITKGQAVLYKLSIREGLTWWETARAVEEQGFARYEDFKAVIHDPAFLREFNIPFANAEGFLYPETYLMKKPPARDKLDKAQAREVAAIMVRMFWKQTEPVWTQLPTKQEAQKARSAAPAGAMASPAPISAPAVAPSVSAPAPVAAPPAVSAPPVATEPSSPAPAVPGAVVPSAPDAQAGAPTPVQSPAAPQQHIYTGNTTSAAVPETNATATVAPETNATVPSAAPPVVRNATASNSTAAISPVPAAPTVPSAPASAANATAQAPKPAPANGTVPTPAVPVARPDGPQQPGDIAPAALRQLIILASLVEKETAIPTERGRVAGVYSNRLRLNMLLQCDPTIIYGVGETFTGAIRRSQLNDAGNLYNTYKHPGLPPGPICSSGMESLKAAFTPEKHDYLYFVATGLDGSHTFNKTLTEHNKDVEIYRARMRGVGK